MHSATTAKTETPKKETKAAKADEVKVGELSVDSLAGLMKDENSNVAILDSNGVKTREKHGMIPGATLLTDYREFDKSELGPEARQSIENNVSWMKEDSVRTLTIEGHTDEAGTTDYNLALGELRARETKAYMVRMGIDSSRITIITFGEERLASKQDSLNRRSMFIATKRR